MQRASNLPGVAPPAASRLVAVVIAVAAATAACRAAGQDKPPLLQPGAPGRATHVVEPAHVEAPQSAPNAADVSFMQGMIGHHAQAVEMVGLIQTRTTREDMRLLGLRIEVSQSDEIRMMQRWLQTHGQPLPDPHAHHMPGMLMPGMLTAEEMTRLAEARGPAFDRLFLQGMIKHHQGALTMVRTLFATADAAQDPDIFAFASDVDADQRMEIDRMRALLDAR
jgi:uncharacterized protein (DUF305 family)